MALGEEGNEAMLGEHVGNEELRHPQQGVGELSWEQRFKNLQQKLSRVKEVVRGRAPDTMDTLVQQTESPFTAEVLHFPLPAKFRMPQVEAFDGVKDQVDHLNTYKNQMELHGYQDSVRCRAFSITLKGPPWTGLIGFPRRQSPHSEGCLLCSCLTSLGLGRIESRVITC